MNNVYKLFLLHVRFSPPGIVLTVAANEGRLDLSLLVPAELRGPHSRGLFGVFDGDRNNDLTPLRGDGTNGIPLRMSGVSERNIFDNFADTCTWLERPVKDRFTRAIY